MPQRRNRGSTSSLEFSHAHAHAHSLSASASSASAASTPPLASQAQAQALVHPPRGARTRRGSIVGRGSTDAPPAATRARSGSAVHKPYAPPAAHSSSGRATQWSDKDGRKKRPRPLSMSMSIGFDGHDPLRSPLRLPRRWTRLPRSPRRIAYFVLGVVAAFTVLVLFYDADEGMLADGIDGVRRLITPAPAYAPCHFVSTVEAYHLDLARLRKLYPPNGTEGTPAGAHHTFSPTGHLLLSSDPGAPHPIPQLLALGEKHWEELLAKQSQTLSQAVAEYQRRYKRNPPRGFDKWWEFAIERDLVLPDEYDRINLDLAPFWALPKAEMKKRLQWVEDMPEVFILDVRDGEVTVDIKDKGGLEWRGTLPRAEDLVSLMQTFSQLLPDLRATFSIFDQPQIYLSWARRESLVKLGLQGEHTTHITEEDNHDVQLSRSCPPTSNLRRNASMYEGKSFVYDTLEASDFCQNPYLVPLHGLTIEPHTSTSHPKPHTQLLPLFSLTKTVINSDIVVTPLEQFFDDVHRDRPWEKKTDSRLAWRGSATGISMMSKDVNWRQSHRVRLHNFANNHSDAAVEYIVPDLGQNGVEGAPGRETLGYTTETKPQGAVLDHFFDIKLTGGDLQCNKEDGTCDELLHETKWAPIQSPAALYRHKFLLDIDGNGWSGRFRRLMSSNSMVIKTGLFTEWYQDHIVPWFMYVPSKLDFSDLTDIMSFFAGSPAHPDIAFDETARAIAVNGQCFVERMFRYDDLQAYMMRLFLEYARLAGDGDMDFHYDPAEHGDPAFPVEHEEGQGAGHDVGQYE